MVWAEPIAVVGLAGRFPGAADVDQFWDNLVAGRDCLSTLSDEQLLAHGEDPEQLGSDRFVRRRPVLEGADSFDAGLFGLTRREAETRDPQHRLLLEAAHAALEHAGYDPRDYAGYIGLYAGANQSRYRYDHLEHRPDVFQSVGHVAIDIGNSPDYLATFVSYKLGLRGPSMTVLTACSTALVSVHMACVALRAGDCEMAIAGGVDVEFPFHHGYLHHPGGIWAEDGVLRPFAERATGTNFGNGAGVVVLKPLAAATADRDTVYAVIRGSAVNNDGDRKVGFTAPSVVGQSECIQRALRAAGIDPRTIAYVEAHGTATPVGDPVEIAGLVDAYRAVGGDDLPNQYCAIGSVKSNVGHLGQAAGIAGLIKVVLALRYGVIPASINVDTPNRRVDWTRSPFTVVTKTATWPDVPGRPRRAAVSSFGFGGTNAHVVLEQAPARQKAATKSRPVEAVLWSGADAQAVERQRTRLARYFTSLPAGDFADAAHTLRVGRRAHAVRAAVVAADGADAATALGRHERHIRPDGVQRRIAFAFAGSGSTQPELLHDLYTSEPLFREGCDAAFGFLDELLGADLRGRWLAGDEQALADPLLGEPLLFTLQFTLASCLVHWGVRPDVVFGHGLGELTACATAGVMDFGSAVHAVAGRAEALRRRRPARLLAVGAPVHEVAELLPDDVTIAAVNDARQVVLCGPPDAVRALADVLRARHLPARLLDDATGLHPADREAVASQWRRRLGEVALREPDIAVVAASTGCEVSPAQAVSPAFWTRQLSQTIRFDAAAARVLAGGPVCVVEVGPGVVLEALLTQRRDFRAGRCRFVATSPTKPGESAVAALESALARLWVEGVPVRYWHDLGTRGYRRTAAPGYPYDRQRYWVSRPPPIGGANG
jgi:phthiocerol/phenolphthiocerol synthesis type-I polyketide synthase E